MSSNGIGRFALLCLGVWLHSADTLVTATIAPALVEDLGGIAYINWTIALYEVGAIVAGAAAAVLCARFGIKRVFVGAALVYGGGCVIGALAPSMEVLIAGRCVQGMGGGTLLTLCYVAVERWYAPARWGRLFGVVAMVWGGGSLLGPLIGAAFGGPHAWRGAFWSFALQAAVLIVLAGALFPRDAARRLAASPDSSPVPVPTLDPVPAPIPRAPGSPAAPARPRAGFLHQWPVLTLALLTLATLLIAESGVLRNVAGSIAGCAAGAVLLYVAARVDRHSAVRLLPTSLLDARHPAGAGLLMVFAFAMGTTSFWAYGPLLLKIIFDVPPLVTGYILAGEALAWSAGTLAVSRATTTAEVRLIRIGALGIAAGSAGFAIAVPAGSLPGMIGCGLLQGAGFGVCWPAFVQRIVRFSPAAEQSLASAAVSTVQRTGYAVGTAAVGIAANLSGLAEGNSITAAKAAGFWVFAFFIPVLLAGLALAWRFTQPHDARPSAQ